MKNAARLWAGASSGTSRDLGSQTHLPEPQSPPLGREEVRDVPSRDPSRSGRPLLMLESRPLDVTLQCARGGGRGGTERSPPPGLLPRGLAHPILPSPPHPRGHRAPPACPQGRSRRPSAAQGRRSSQGPTRLHSRPRPLCTCAGSTRLSPGHGTPAPRCPRGCVAHSRSDSPLKCCAASRPRAQPAAQGPAPEGLGTGSPASAIAQLPSRVPAPPTPPRALLPVLRPKQGETSCGGGRGPGGLWGLPPRLLQGDQGGESVTADSQREGLAGAPR